VPKEVRALIRAVSRQNPLWGTPRVHGELLRLGLDIGETSVSRYLVRRCRPLSHTWRAFFDNHLKTMVSVGLLYGANDSVPGAVRVLGAGAQPAAYSGSWCNR
jgi:hypothetical protein